MSHASCLVITDEQPTHAELSRILQPWHEFECTGINDRYVKEIDETARLREEYAGHKKTMIRMQDGSLADAFSDRFYRDPTEEEKVKVGTMMGTGFGHGLAWTSQDWGDGQGYRAKVRYIPEGCNEVEVLADAVTNFRDWVVDWTGREVVRFREKIDRREAHKYGYVQLGPDGEVLKVVDRTNPNKKWDYWTVGGRYAGRLRALADSKTASLAVRGDLLGYQPSAAALRLGDKKPTTGCLDQCRRGDMDLDAMKRFQVAKRQEWADECCTKAAGTPTELDIACRTQHHVHAAWEVFPEPRPRGEEYHAWIEERGGDWAVFARFNRANWELPNVKPNQSLTDWITAAPPLTSWAVVLDEQWFEKGKMGWWGMSSDDQADWDDKFDDLFALIRSEQWLTVIDYHI